MVRGCGEEQTQKTCVKDEIGLCAQNIIIYARFNNMFVKPM